MAAYTTIDNPELFFEQLLWTGNGANGRALTWDGDNDFAANLIIIRGRVATARTTFYDTIRGVQKKLDWTQNAAEATETDGLTAFSSDGFTIGSTGEVNYNNDTFEAFGFKAGTTSGISGSPSITPAGYSFNATSGFSIITWTGTGANATLPHGLGVAPGLILIKNRDGGHWRVYHHKNTSAPETDFLVLSGTEATSDNNTAFNDTAPTSTLFSVGSMDETNKNTEGMVAYCFAEKQGFSKFGQYEGNNNADGPCVNLGFRPSIVITKAIDTTSNWLAFDSKRSPFNDVDDYMKLNATASEDTGSSDVQMDFLSNGFKLRGNNSVVNGAETYVYLAFAESPFVNSNGVPNNAR